MASKAPNKRPEVRVTIQEDGNILRTTVPPFWGINRKERRKMKLPPSTDHQEIISAMKTVALPEWRETSDE